MFSKNVRKLSLNSTDNDYMKSVAITFGGIIVFPCLYCHSGGGIFAEFVLCGLNENGDMAIDRFVIEEGECLEAEEEKIFLDYCRNSDLKITEWDLKKYVTAVQRYMNDIHYKNYDVSNVGMAMQAFYHSVNRGPLEKLYKAELSNVAFRYGQLCNAKGTTPSEIMKDLPLKLLRILEMDLETSKPLCETDTNVLMSELKSNEAAYDIFTNHFSGFRTCDYTQWQYLKAIANDETVPINRTLYKRLSGAAPFLVDTYVSFFDLRKKFCNYYPITEIPYEGELSSLLYRLETLEGLCQKYGSLDCPVPSPQEELYWKNENYVVTFPKTIADLTREAANQSNCLVDYIEGVMNGKTTIGFIRFVDTPDDSYVTFEIRSKTIEQAFLSMNRPVGVEMQAVIDEYAKEKGLFLDYEEEYVDEDDDGYYLDLDEIFVHADEDDFPFNDDGIWQQLFA